MQVIIVEGEGGGVIIVERSRKGERGKRRRRRDLGKTRESAFSVVREKQPHPVILRMRVYVKGGNFSIRTNFLPSAAIFSEAKSVSCRGESEM